MCSSAWEGFHSERVKDRQRIESVLMTGPEECYTTDRYLDFSKGDDKILLEKSYTRSTLLFITNSISPALKKNAYQQNKDTRAWCPWIGSWGCFPGHILVDVFINNFNENIDTMLSDKLSNGWFVTGVFRWPRLSNVLIRVNSTEWQTELFNGWVPAQSRACARQATYIVAIPKEMQCILYHH